MKKHLDLISINRATDELGVSRTWIYNQVDRGTFRILKLGGKSFLSINELNAVADSSSSNKTNKKP